ncbi:MAG TPA: hypothetical protein VLN46_02550 [Gillisia sp.]|nr:hypothetical protein [Gillisia sp.]
MPSIEKLYENLGKLFYAIAAADKVIHEEEIETLEKIVREDWVKVDDLKDEFGTDEAFYIEIMFDWMQENSPPAFQAFYEFKDFKEENEKMFTPKIKELTWKTAESIAASFESKDPAEETLLSKLKEIL